MKKLMSLFLALLMVYTFLPVSVLADNDAEGDPSAEIMTQTAEDLQPEPEEDPTENPGGTPEEKAEENPEDETTEAGLIAFLGADSRDETLAYHYRVETAAGETVTLAPQPDYTDESVLSYVWARFDAEQDTYVELPEETGAVLTLTAAAEEIGVEKLYACTVTAPDAAGTAVFTLVDNKLPTGLENQEGQKDGAQETGDAIESVSVMSARSGRYGVTNTKNASGADIIAEARKWANAGASYWSHYDPWYESVYWRTGYEYNGQFSFDCSGFVSRVLNDAGFRGSDYAPYSDTILNSQYGSNCIAITIEDLVNYGTDVTSAVELAKTGDYSQLKVGDVIGWARGPEKRRVIFYAGLDSAGYPTMVEFTGNGYYDRRITAEYQNLFQYGARFTNIESGYLSKCEYYPSYLSVKMTKDYRVWSLPCSNETDAKSSVIKTVASGTSLTVTALYKNGVTTSDHYWYRVRLSDGTEGYVYAPFCKVTNYCDSAIKNGISASGKNVPATLPVSEIYAVDWTIISNCADISAISGYIHVWGDTISYDRTAQMRSKNLNGSPIDTAMHFDWIASPGNYDFYIKVQVKNYYCADNSNTLQSKTIEKTVLNGPITFTNGNSGHTTHSYTSQVVKPTCTEEGYTLYTCSECGASYKDNYVAANGHSWNDRDYVITVEPTCETPGEGGYRCFWCDAILPVTLASKGHSWNSGTVTTAATCEKSGVKTYTCTVCKTTKTETIAALGHSYKETKITGSCTQRPGTKYDCTRCGNSYTAWDEASWSSWSTEKPSGYTGGDIESATQYRYRDKDTTTSSSASMTGWTLSGSEKVWGDYGAWSDWTTEAVSASDSTQVETAPLYRYYYFLCSKCGDHNPFSGNCGCGGTSNDWHERYSTISYSQSSSTVVSYASSKRQTTSLGDGELWYFSGGNLNATAIGTTDADGNSVVIRQGYRYRTRTQNTVYHFYRWGDWSSWSLTKATATGSREVETRTVYRYNLYAKGQHKWDSGVVTTPAKPGIEGVKTYTCTACKQTRTEVIPALPITYTVSYDANGGSGAPASQTKTKDVALTLSSTKPTRTGYKFLGWAASKTATSAQYQPGGSYTANAAVTLYAVWKENDYTVSYDANGGTGAPAAQTKKHGTALTLSSTKPTRTGYMFLGWAASKTATSAQYQPGGSYTAHAAVTLYAVWKENAPTYATTLTVSSATASQGKEVSLNISLAGNPGIIGINFQITYDKTRLKLIGYTDGAMKDWSVGIGESEKAIWIDEAADVINGNILTLKFQVLDNAPDGLAEVTVTGFKAAALDESAVKANIVAGSVTVTSRIPGDVNDDGEVDIFDCVRLKKYLAGFNVTINASNADVNGDGEVDIFDCVRLKKYLAGMSVELK